MRVRAIDEGRHSHSDAQKSTGEIETDRQTGKQQAI